MSLKEFTDTPFHLYKTKLNTYMTLIEATEVYNNIIAMLNNDRIALTSYLLRIAFENSQLNDGNRRETVRLLEALKAFIDEAEKTHDPEIKRKALVISGILYGTTIGAPRDVLSSNNKLTKAAV